jgi:DNA repair protein RadC
MKTPIRSEDAPEYVTSTKPAKPTTADEDRTISQALRILASRMRKAGAVFSSPDATRSYLKLQLAKYPYEVFACLFLDNRHRLIEYRELFRGTIDGASVHPREVVRACIELNAAAVVFAHNHPSGVEEPSQSDLRITKRLQDTLALIDVRVLDHIIVGEGEGTSLAERGLI